MIIILEEKTYNKHLDRHEGQSVTLRETDNPNFVELLVDDSVDMYELTLNVVDVYDAMVMLMARREREEK